MHIRIFFHPINFRAYAETHTLMNKGTNFKDSGSLIDQFKVRSDLKSIEQLEYMKNPMDQAGYMEVLKPLILL